MYDLNNLTLAANEVLVLRKCQADYTSHNGFKYPEVGSVEAPDWDATPSCGGGLHGLLWGVGSFDIREYGALYQLILVNTDNGLMDLEDKVKFRKGYVLISTDNQPRISELLLRYAPSELHGRINFTIITQGDRSTATQGYRSTATQGDRSTVTQERSSTATQGDDSTATQGDGSTATQGNRSTATQGDGSTATQGYRSTATQGHGSTARQGNWSKVTQGNDSTATQGDGSTATQGDGSTATQGNWSKVTQGNWSKVTQGGRSTLIIPGDKATITTGIGSKVILLNYGVFLHEGKDFVANKQFRIRDGQIVKDE